ncbi:MAG TPA: cell surface protein, partial [Gammaproteobacteria bacterium]|nr:cell surface protein [Gammaproteobacteria bacterium]
MKKSYFFKFFVFALVGAIVFLPSCKDYDDDISRLDKELGDAKTELTGSIASQLAALKAELNTSVDNKVKTVADDLAASKVKLAALEANSATKDQLDDVKAEILQQVVTLEVLEDLQADYDSEIAAILARIATLEEDGATKAELAALETEITGMLSELQASLDALDVRLTSLEKSHNEFMAKHDEDLQDVIASIATLKAELDPRISTIETLLDIAEGKSGVLKGITDSLAVHLTKIGANADAIALLRTDLEAELADQLVLINANKTAIEAVETDLATKYAELVEADSVLLAQIEANYEELDGKITLNKDAIDALTLRVDAIEEELEEIWTEIGELEGRLNLRINSVFKLVTSRLTAITLAPNAYVEGIEAIKFTSLVYRPMLADENAAIPNGTGNQQQYTLSIGAPTVASYKFNPRTFKLSDADYGYVDRKAEVISTRAAVAASNLVIIEGEPKEKIADGTVNFTLRRINYLTTQPTGNVENFVALEATLKDNAVAEDEEGVVVAAQQELVYDHIYNAVNIRIADKATLETEGNDAHYPTTFDAAVAGKIWYEDMTYDKVYDLLTKVATCTNDGNNHEPFNIEDYGLKYKFYVASSAYNITTGSTVTNQQSYIELVNGDEGTFKAKDFNKEAIGRTPIFKVELVDGSGNVVRRAFVKVKIGVKRTEDILVGKAAYDLLYDCEGEASYVLDEVFIRENVYRVIANTQGQVSMSHEEFWNMYEFDKAVVTKDGYTKSMTAPIIVDGDAGTGTATKKIVWTFDKGEIGKVGNGTQLVATLTVKNKLVSSEYPAYVTFRFVVNVTLPTFELDKVENEIYWENNQYQVNIAVPTSPTDVADNAIFRTSLPQAYFEYDVEFEGNDACGSYSYKVVNTFSNGGKDNPKLSGVGIDGDYITLDKSSNAVKAALNSTAGLQAEVQHVYSYGNDDEVVINTFMVNFVRPVNFNMPDNAEVVDATDDGDEVDFNWSGLLTDWRGKAILEPGEIAVTNCSGVWEEQPIVEYVYQP